MSVGIVIGIILYIVVAIIYGLFINVLIISDFELLDMFIKDGDRYFASAIIGIFWCITFPILLFNTFFRDKNKE